MVDQTSREVIPFRFAATESYLHNGYAQVEIVTLAMMDPDHPDLAVNFVAHVNEAVEEIGIWILDECEELYPNLNSRDIFMN